uniref:UDP-N-acetylmuramate--L-alanine ligase n=1 Tax=Candidatus Aschnera chinzeii TaxID=1485666 RepID=A0AAT9G4L4_9ENTR|nr:MAG: UDP-N-acetylmuramate--L-alanine ligase [Candidatus Aschnera chinzeii]
MNGIQKIIKTINIIPKMYKTHHIHFVGIGGYGMGGIAKILMHEGYKITGSDLVSNIITHQLTKLGIKIFFNHSPKNITNACVVVVSSAIPHDNPEIIAAIKLHIPVIRRTEMLAELMRCRHSIAITGTHGKTTTTAMITNIYITAGLDPTFINGGIIKNEGTYAHLGSSRYLIAEVDESDPLFLILQPVVVIITNIEPEHIENYNGDFEKLKYTFINFLDKMPFHGLVILCIDDPVVRSLIPNIKHYIITYGFSKDADVRITSYHQYYNKTFFSISRKNKNKIKFILNIPGRHNVLNATAAIAIAIENNINITYINNALKNFQGTERRFDHLGCFTFKNIHGTADTAMLIDDYGHHPTEINATIKTARQCWPNKRIIMIFQPHRYTRTKNLYNEFIDVLETVDILILLNVFSAGEKHISGADSQSLCATIRKRGKINPVFIKQHDKINKILKQIIKNNDLIITQGAGNINIVAQNIIKKYS